MIQHPITQPLLYQFVTAESDAARAALMLATPHAVLAGYQGQYRRVARAVGMAAASDYLDAVLAIGAAVRDATGRAPLFLEEQLTAARVRLAIEAGAIVVVEPPGG